MRTRQGRHAHLAALGRVVEGIGQAIALRILHRVMRDKLLNEPPFLGPDHAKAAVARWVADYNQRRLHSASG